MVAQSYPKNAALPNNEKIPPGKASTNGGDVRNGHSCRRLRRNREGALLNILNSARGMIL
jgi:hypothetical protein